MNYKGAKDGSIVDAKSDRIIGIKQSSTNITNTNIQLNTQRENNNNRNENINILYDNIICKCFIKMKL